MAKKKESPLAGIVEAVTGVVGGAAETVGETVGSVAGAVTEKVSSVVGGDVKPAKATRTRSTTKTKAVATKEVEPKVVVEHAPAEARPIPDHLSRRRTEVGRVVSDKMQRTVVVQVQRSKQHPIYKKVMRQSIKFMAHDDMGAGMGDTVRIMESRPMSKNKRWRVIEIVQRAE